jgi:hypothetical protein
MDPHGVSDPITQRQIDVLGIFILNVIFLHPMGIIGRFVMVYEIVDGR